MLTREAAKSERCITSPDVARARHRRRRREHASILDRGETHASIQALPVRPTPTTLTLGILLDRVDTGAFTVTRSTYDPGKQLPSHAHDLASATIVLRGNVTERVANRRFDCDREHTLVRPAAVVHSNSYGTTGAECMIVGAQADWVADDVIARRVFSAPRLTRGSTPPTIVHGIRRELRVGDEASALALEGLALELVASLARQLDSAHTRVALPWLRAIRERLHDDYQRAIRLHCVAREAGVHPVHLARAFRQCFGCSPGEYVRQRRIDRACVELAESERSIAEIALGAGFSSPSHFATAFRRATGASPTDYRRLAQHARTFRS